MAIVTSAMSLVSKLHLFRSTRLPCSSFSSSRVGKKKIASSAKVDVKKKEKKTSAVSTNSSSSEEKLKRRTRSEKTFDVERIVQYGAVSGHIPVMLGEVLEVFSASPHFHALRSFVDCTVGAAGHSSAIIQGHPELELYIGMDVDPVAFKTAREKVKATLREDDDESALKSHVKVFTFLRNFRDIKTVLCEIDDGLPVSGVDGILMDLGMSSMQVNNADRGFSVLGEGPLDMRMNPQATLKAEDILNTWPDTEVGRILRDYGEESNWWHLQNRIIRARENGGLHSTGELVDLIRNTTARTRGGRQGWIKTATRVFQALRIAVNDELKVLEDSLYECFDCLTPGGRLAVISFHSLEDRIVKQTFLNIIDRDKDGHQEDGDEGGEPKEDPREIRIENDGKEAWIKQTIKGKCGTILTKRPITPCKEEEDVNRRSRSAKLRVLQKL